MPGVDVANGLIAVPFWAAGALAALFVGGCVLAFNRSGTGAIGGAVRISIILIGALMVWAFVERAAVRDSDAEGRAIESRAAELTARAIAAGSPLACLDGIAGETVEAACEKAIFANPETVAAAISYVSARLTLLADVLAYDKTPGKSINISPNALRRSLGADRFGFVAQVLAMRDGCIGPNCKALDILGDAIRVRANLGTHTLDRYLSHYAEEWAKEPAIPAPVAEAAPAKPKVSVNIDFPSAASIPAVSIMNAEPTGPVLPGVAAAAAANPNPPPTAPAQTTSRHSSRKHAGAPPPAQPAAQAAAQPAPPITSTPAIPATPAMSGPPATTGPAVVPPVQLVPSFPPAAGASAGLQ